MNPVVHHLQVKGTCIYIGPTVIEITPDTLLYIHTLYAPLGCGCVFSQETFVTQYAFQLSRKLSGGVGLIRADSWGSIVLGTVAVCWLQINLLNAGSSGAALCHGAGRTAQGEQQVSVLKTGPPCVSRDRPAGRLV